VTNTDTLPLYTQKAGGRDHLYFFHDIDIRFIENDEQIQLRPLEPKILPLIFNLKQSVQLLPSLGRLNDDTKTVKIFDGQHTLISLIFSLLLHLIPPYMAAKDTKSPYSGLVTLWR
jgi:hypothetical protein